MSTTKKKSTVKKPAAKNTGAKKTAAKKTGTKKTASKAAVKKTTVRKTPTRKAAVTKPPVRKPAAKEPGHDHGELSRIGAENLHAMAANIDRQMKKLAEMNTRVIIAKDQLTEFREMVQAKIHDFQEKRSADHAEGHTDIMRSIRHARDEAARHIKESEAINEAYDKLLKQLEKGREAALRETRKAEKVFKEKFHELEAVLKQKASEIKENIKNK